MKAALLGLIALAAASDVKQLTGKTFNKYVGGKDLVIAEFYAPWCGHCKALEPEYEKAATALKEHDICVAKIDCTEDQEFCSEHGVVGYPTLKIFKGTENVGKYEGARSGDAITQYMIRRSLPVLQLVKDAEALEAFLSDKSVAPVAFFDDAKTNGTLTEVAEKLREQLTFGASNDAKLAKAHGVKAPALVVFKHGEEPVVYEGKLEPEDVLDFLSVESFPSFGEIGPENYMAYTQSGVPLMFAFVENDEQRKEVRSHLEPHIADLKGKAHIVFLNTTQFGGHAENVNIRPEYPALVVHDIRTNKKYTHSQDEKLSARSVADYVKSFVKGTLKPTIKSAEIPETQDGPVYTLVAKDYDSVVLDDDKDVLVEFYAPWCGHCKNLVPVYDQLGALYADHPEVVVAKLDHTENEVPDKISGYPTLKLYPAHAKDKPIEYSGPRALEDLAAFIRDKGTHQVDVTVDAAVEAEEDDDHDDL